MDSVRVGRQLWALRHRQRLTQHELSVRAGVSRSQVSRAERGSADRLQPVTLERIAGALGARLEVRITWNGEALDRLMDSAHAALVDAVVQALQAAGWECSVEVSFNVRGERGSIDVLARHRRSGILLVIEVKSVVPDVQAMLMTLDRKARLGREIAAGRGWPTVAVARILVVGESRTSRRRIDFHRSLFEAALPARTVEIRRWLHAPDPDRPIRGIWFLSSERHTTNRHRVSRRCSATDARPRSAGPNRDQRTSSDGTTSGHVTNSG